MNRAKIVAGNWKMNNDLTATKDLIHDLKRSITSSDQVKVKIAPAFVNLQAAKELADNSALEVIAQNMHFEESGAFTGEVSASMLLGIGIKEVILGHSERRSLFGESDKMLKKKVQAALDHGMNIIFCFGEMLDERKEGRHFEVVKNQLSAALFGLEQNSWDRIVLAYEPVWAIGTGETASPAQAQEMHAFIRNTLTEAYTDSLANSVSILYGGSVKPNNARELFGQPDVDGGLIGGASLVAEDFASIVDACSSSQ